MVIAQNKKSQQFTLTAQTPVEEIAHILAALMTSLAEKHHEINENIKSLDEKHGKNYKTLLEFTDDLNKTKIMKLRDPIDGLDGQDGLTPRKGIDYFDGYTPLKGIDYFDGERGERGLDGSPDTGEEIVDKLEGLDEEGKLSMRAIRGLRKELQRIHGYFKDTSWLPNSVYGGVNQLRLLSNGVLTGDNGVKFINFINATVVNDDQGNATVTVTGGSSTNFVDNEIVTRASSAHYTLANIPIVGSEHLFGGGSRLTAGVDYTISGTAIVTTNDYGIGGLVADYRI
jgi:hypothetical protein